MSTRTEPLDQSLNDILFDRGATVAAESCTSEDLERSRIVCAKAALRILKMWRIGRSDQLRILDLDKHEQSLIDSVSEGRYVDFGTEGFARCEILIGIFRALIHRRPDHASFSRGWVHSPNQDLDWRSPFELLLEGRDGFLRVLHMLEAHDQTLSS